MAANDIPKLNLSPEQQRMLLKTASSQLGIPQSELENLVQSGAMDSLQKRAGPELGKLLGDPLALEALFSSPQARAALKKIMGGG